MLLSYKIHSVDPMKLLIVEELDFIQLLMPSFMSNWRYDLKPMLHCSALILWGRVVTHEFVSIHPMSLSCQYFVVWRQSQQVAVQT